MKNCTFTIFLAQLILSMGKSEASIGDDAYPHLQFDLCGEFTFNVDYLYWNTCSQGFFYTLERVGDFHFQGTYNQAVASSHFHYHYKRPDNCGQSGFRVGLSYLYPRDYWVSSLQWTHFCANDNRHFRSSDPLYIPFSTFRQMRDSYAFTSNTSIFSDAPISVTLADHVKGKWKLDLDWIDLAFGYPTTWCDRIDFQPHADLRLFWTEQQFHVSASGDLINLKNQIRESTEFYGNFDSHESLEIDYWGVGPRFGIDIDWDLYCGFGLYGGFAGSIVYGERNTHARLHLERTNTIGADGQPIFTEDTSCDDLLINQKRHSSKSCSRAILDLNIGVFWHLASCKYPFSLVIKVGWEQHAFYNQGMGDLDAAGRSYISREGNNLYTQGLDLSVNFVY